MSPRPQSMMSMRSRTTANTTQNSVVGFDMDQRRGVFDSLTGEAELEKFDRNCGHQYIPMDIYVDPTTIKEHFRASSIRNRWARKYQHAS
jgi:hypothetical protein